MAQDDMHVIMYRILAYLYDCMKRGRDVDPNLISFERLCINKRYWVAIMVELAERGFVKGAVISHADDETNVYLREPTVTMAGVEFLMENSMMNKAKRFLQDFKASVPGI